MKVLFLVVVIAVAVVLLGEYQKPNKFQSKTKILSLIKLGNFSQNLSTANFSTFSKFSKFNKFYDEPNMFEVFILGGIVF